MAVVRSSHAAHPSFATRRCHRLGAVAAAVWIAAAVVTAPATPTPAAPGLVAAEPVLTVGAQRLTDRYDELRPLINHGAAQLHWALQFVPVPGNVRFHTWTFYQHFVDPMVYSAVRNASAAIDGGASVDVVSAALAGDAFSALGEFVAAEFSGHSNVVPPNSDAAAGADPWVHWAIEVAVAPLYYLPVPPALIVQVPIITRFGVDIADSVAINVGAVLAGANAPEHAVRAIGEFIRDDALPRLMRAERAVFTPPHPSPQASTSAPTPEVIPPESPGQTDRIVLRNIVGDDAAVSAAPRIKTSPAVTDARAHGAVRKPRHRLPDAVGTLRERINAPRVVQRLNRHSTPRPTVGTAVVPGKEPTGAGRPDDVDSRIGRGTNAGPSGGG